MNSFDIPSEYKRFPAAWKVLPFGNAIKDVTGGNPKVKSSDYLEQGPLAVVDQGQSNIAGYIEDESLACKASLPTIVFGDHTKALKFIEQPFALGADGVKILEPIDAFDKRFAYHYLNQLSLPDSAGYSRHFKFLKEKFIPLPPLPEQRRIADILDKADAIRRKRQQAIRLTEDFLRSVFLDMFGDPVTNPKGWKVRAIGEITFIDAPMVDPREEQYQDLLHIGPDRIEKATGRLLPAKSAKEDGLISGKFLFDERHVLYSKIRPLLRKVALPGFSGLCSADVYPVRVDDELMTKEFLWYILLSDSFLNFTQTLSSRANIPKINRKEFAAYPCYLPPLSMQEEFSERLLSTMAVNDKLLLNQWETENLFNSLVQRAFRGDL